MLNNIANKPLMDWTVKVATIQTNQQNKQSEQMGQQTTK